MPIFPWGRQHEAVKKAGEFLAECCKNMGLEEKSLGKTGREWVARRKWEDDPAEMRRVVYYAALSSSGKEVEAAHFPPRRRQDHEAYAKKQFEELSLEDAVRHKIAHFFGRLGKIEVKDVRGTVVAQVERSLISECLKWAGGNQQKAARVLGINRNTLRKKMRELKIKCEEK